MNIIITTALYTKRIDAVKMKQYKYAKGENSGIN